MNLNIHKILLIGSLLTFTAACQEGDLYYLPDGDKYDQLYIVQAASGMTEVNLLSSQTAWSSSFNAFYSSLSAPSDINMTFEADNDLILAYNEEHATSYSALPEGSFTLGAASATIKAGEYRTGLIPIELDVARLEIETPYLLAIAMRVKNADILVNEDLDKLYFTFMVQKDRTPVVLDGNVRACDEFFSFHDRCILTRNRTSGELNRYLYDPETNTLTGPETLHSDWTAGNVRWIQAGMGHTLQCVNGAYTWYVIDCNEDGSQIPIWQTTSAVITGGCSIFMDAMICEAPDGGYMNIWAGSGNVAYYGLTADGHGLNGIIAHTNPGDGTNIATQYRIRFLWKGDLFCIDGNGDLWKYPWNSSSHALGARSQVGSGWGKFVNVTSYGDDFLMLCSDGSVMKIEYEPDVFWALSD